MDDLATTESFVYFVETYVSNLGKRTDAIFPHAVVLSWMETARNVDFPLTTSHLGRFCRALCMLAASDVEFEVKETATDLLLQYLIPDLYYIPFVVWQERRDPYFTLFLLEHLPEAEAVSRLVVLFALANNSTEWFARYLSSNGNDFANILADADSEIANQSWQIYSSLPPVPQQTFLSIVNESFHTYKNPLILFDCISDNYYFPGKYLRLNVAKALVKNQPVELTEEVIGVLVSFIEQKIEPLQDLAVNVLRNLTSPTAQEFLYLWLVRRENETVTQIAIEKAYAPTGLNERAIFYFLTRQFTKYDELDFDHRMMRVFYEKNTTQMRRRINNIVRESGRADYTDILTRRQQKLSAGTSDEEILAVIQVLYDVQDWQTLWELVFELPFNHSLRVLLLLSDGNWQPSTARQQQFLQELTVLAHRIVPLKDEYLPQVNPAIMYRRLNIPDRLVSINFETDELHDSIIFPLFSMTNLRENILPTILFFNTSVRFERTTQNKLLFSVFQEGENVRCSTLKIPGNDLKYFDVSPDGWSLLTLNETHAFLWDLTLIRLSDIFSLSASAKYNKLQQGERIRQFIEVTPELPMRVRNILLCYQKIAMAQFYDAVELDFNFSVAADRTDIELEPEENS
jgi:hypothetical protein